MLAVIRAERRLEEEGYAGHIVDGASYAENVNDAHDSVGDNPLLRTLR